MKEHSDRQVRTLGQLMSREVKTLGRNDQLTVADATMQMGRIRHLPVLDEGGRLVGIVTQRDLYHSALVRALGFGTAARDKMLAMIVVKEVMTTDVTTATRATTVAAAARLMCDRKIGCLPIVEQDKLLGIVTESDLVALLADDDTLA